MHNPLIVYVFKIVLSTILKTYYKLTVSSRHDLADQGQIGLQPVVFIWLVSLAHEHTRPPEAHRACYGFPGREMDLIHAGRFD